MINKNIMYGIFAIIYYGLTRHTIRKKYQCKVYCTTELSGNLWKGREFSGNFTKQILKNYEWKHFCYNIKNYYMTKYGI